MTWERAGADAAAVKRPGADAELTCGEDDFKNADAAAPPEHVPDDLARPVDVAEIYIARTKQVVTAAHRLPRIFIASQACRRDLAGPGGGGDFRARFSWSVQRGVFCRLRPGNGWIEPRADLGEATPGVSNVTSN